MIRPIAYSDQEVLQQAAHDPGWLSILVDRYRNPLYHFVFRFVGDQETAEDLVQETFLRCLKHRAKGPAVEYVSTWLYTIAGNLAKSELRRRKRWRWVPISSTEDPVEAYYEPIDPNPRPDERTDTHTACRTVTQAIAQLPEEFRQAVLLRDVNQLSYQEIAAIADCPVGTIKSRVNRGRLRLREHLGPLAGEIVDSLTASSTVRA